MLILSEILIMLSLSFGGPHGHPCYGSIMFSEITDFSGGIRIWQEKNTGGYLQL